jgi:tRNA U34 5-carboxymethylaminomethyl modifying enzyme MnmG/GidA
MEEGAIYCPEIPIPHNKCENRNRHQIFLQLPGERKNFKLLLPPMPVANMDFIM